LNWFKKSKAEQKAMWKASCQELLNDFLKTTNDTSEQEKLKKASQRRFEQGCLQFKL
jgi:hypothetical protein